MKKITRWSPDTCGCIIDYEWDTDDPPETRAHTASNVVQACQQHSNLPNKHAHFAALLQHNRANNRKE